MLGLTNERLRVCCSGGERGALHQQRGLSDAAEAGAAEADCHLGSGRELRGGGGRQRGGGEGETTFQKKRKKKKNVFHRYLKISYISSIISNYVNKYT